MKKIKSTLTNEIEDYRILMKNVPQMWLVFYCMAVILMNILANKELINFQYIALDCGFLLSWLVFLCDDVITKRFGAKASVKLTLVGLFLNLCVVLIFFLVSKIPWGHWGEYYTYEQIVVDKALNSTFGGTWYVLLGSSTALLVSSFVNSIINVSLGRMYERRNTDNFKAFAVRSYISTGIGQFVDNFVFAIIVSYNFFGWTRVQVIMCSLTGMMFELFAEIVLSPVGYRVSRKWKENEVGKEYIEFSMMKKG